MATLKDVAQEATRLRTNRLSSEPRGLPATESELPRIIQVRAIAAGALSTSRL